MAARRRTAAPPGGPGRAGTPVMGSDRSGAYRAASSPSRSRAGRPLTVSPSVRVTRLAGWAASRLRLLTADDAASARELAAAQGVAFRGGTGSCVIDTYVTRIGAHRYQEIACLVQGRASASVVAAAPAATWAQASPLLLRAVAAYQVG